MIDRVLFTYVWLRMTVGRAVRDERGEGVISAAIAVLIMAALGAVMWIGIQQLWDNASTRTDNQISQIGS
ncbi:MAG TPA: hypothetical protein VM390_08200 [Acidimicrobiales bacterium]|jgi:uncharacterized protein HemX|nr:hypothetical protein [Acidimicrobiales bacterium]